MGTGVTVPWVVEEYHDTAGGGQLELEHGLQQVLQQAPSSPSRSCLLLCTSVTATLCLFISSSFFLLLLLFYFLF